MDTALEEWFAREVLSHEAALTRYLAHACFNRADVPDLRQEVYIRVLEAAEKSRPLSPRSFLFTTARNLLTDRARRNRIVPIDLLEDLDALNVLIDDVSPERRAGGRQQLLKLSSAFERLPDRCREVVWLRKIEDVPQRQIAERLKITEGTVELHLVRGMRLLTQFFYSGDNAEGAAGDTGKAERENRHEQ